MALTSTQKALGFLLAFTLLFSFFGFQYAGGGDYAFHFKKAANLCTSTDASCLTYTPMFHWLAAPFAFNEKAFWYFCVFLLAFVTPLLLYLISKDWFIVILYFSATSYFWYFIDGIFPQALMGIVLLLFLFFKNDLVRLGLLIGSVFVHGQGFYVAVIVWLVLILFENKDQLVFLCSGIFGLQAPQSATGLYDNIPITAGGFQWHWADLAILFTKIFPVPFLLIAIKEAIDFEDTRLHFALAVIFLVLGFVVSPRVFYFAALVGLFSVAKGISRFMGRFRLGVHGFVVLFFVFQFLSWFNYKITCDG